MDPRPNNAAEARREPFSSRRNLANLGLMVAVGLPWLAVLAWLPGSSTSVLPLVLVNVLFFALVCVLFWLLALRQRSTWLIDPYWTFLPLLIAHTFQLHPGAVWDPVRAGLALAVLWIWSLRLTHNYLRREEWRFGWREDWRLNKYRRRWPTSWWWKSFFVTYVAQQVMLVGLCLPLYAVFASAEPVTLVDWLAAGGCLLGIAIAGLADNQLRGFMLENERRKTAGESKRLLLDTGLWAWSRHPNYFGEQLFWWSLALFGGAAGMWWVVIGPLINTLVLAVVTAMTEGRMSADPRRAQLYADYQRRTSVWVPWPPKQ